MTISGRYEVVLDSCVLLPPSVCDLFLRFAESPRLYLPRWTSQILDEVKRNQLGRLGWEESLAAYWRSEVSRSFPGALIENYEPYIDQCANDPKDRHVLAAAIRAEIETIVTFNLKDFPRAALDPFSVKACDPGAFALRLYEMKPAIVLSKLDDMATDRDRSRKQMLDILRKTMPGFVTRIATELEITD